ncbi:hypothetical protein V2P20_05170 [Methylobacter sp. Wu1]|uniref:hypothetical protein n=1 Tax=Methylobacter sp. Wu1 TaxID=3119359 RepID=UPI002F91F029
MHIKSAIDSVPLITRPCVKEQSILRPSQKAVAKGESVQAFNPNGNIIGRFQLADKLPGRQVKGINLAIAEITHRQAVAEFAKA